jgi:hypothetical protein
VGPIGADEMRRDHFPRRSPRATAGDTSRVRTRVARLATDLAWFRAHLDDDPPLRLHRSGGPGHALPVWSDPDAGGSRLGSPALSAAFERWLEPGRATGHSLYPMRAAIASFDGAMSLADRPGLAVTLRTLVRSRGDIAAAADTLARRWAKMGDPETASAHFAFAIHRLRDVWTRYDVAA